MISNVHSLIEKWRASVYDQTQDASKIAECFLTLLGSAPKCLLEIGCGCGKLLFPLSKAGHDVTGIDRDESMLMHASRKAELTPMRLIKADILIAPWPQAFDSVVIAENLMHNLITDWEYKQAQKQLIMKSAASLKKGGLLLLDFDCPIALTPYTEDKSETCIFEGEDEGGVYGKMYVRNVEADEKSRLMKTRRRYALITPDKNPVSLEETAFRHYLTLEETTSWLYRAGFSIEAVYGSHDFKPFDEKNRRCVIAARKE